MRNIVLDTNVLISALINPEGTPSKILKFINNGYLFFYYDSEIILEYQRVLSRKKFSFLQKEINDTIDILVKFGIPTISLPSNIDMPDESDRKFYDAAVSNEAFLVSGNKKHYPQKDFIVSPSEFMEIRHMFA